MFLWFPVLDLARAPRRTARKKGSGYENESADKNRLTYRYTSVYSWGSQLTYRFFPPETSYVLFFLGGGVAAVTFLCKHHGKVR